MSKKLNQRQILTLIDLYNNIGSSIRCEVSYHMSGNDIDIDTLEKNLIEIVNGACEMLRKQK
jgi:hypothetical protein